MNTTAHAGLSDVGRMRSENEDRWFADPEFGLYLVADGMGGTFGGELAAEAVSTVLPRLLGRKMEGVESLDSPQALALVLEALTEMSDRLREESARQVGYSGIGSTVVLALVRGTRAIIAHMGDSRAYRLHGEELTQLTKDHSIVQLLVDGGDFTPEEAATHPARSQLTRFVGMKEESLPEARLVDLAPGDRLLLCTDGLTGMVSDDDLLSVLKERTDLQEACEELGAAANEAGGVDNVTVLIASLAGEAE